MLHLQEALDIYEPPDLAVLGQNTGVWKQNPKLPKKAMIERIAKRLTSDVPWYDYCQRLPLESRVMLQAILLWPAVYKPDENALVVTACALYKGQFPNKTVDLKELQSKFKQALKNLMNSGMIFPICYNLDREDMYSVANMPFGPMGALFHRAAYAGVWLRDGFVMPLEIAYGVFPSLIKAEYQELNPTSMHLVTRSDGPALLYDLTQLTALAHQTELRLTQKGPLYKKDRDLVESRLLLHDQTTTLRGFTYPADDKAPLRLQWLLAMAAALNLITLEDMALVSGSSANRWMQMSPEQQLLSLAEIWSAYVEPAEPGMDIILLALLNAPKNQWLDLGHMMGWLFHLEHDIAQQTSIWRAYSAYSDGLRNAIAALVYCGLLEVAAIAPDAAPAKTTKQNATHNSADAFLLELLLNASKLEPKTIWLRLTPTGKEVFLHQRIGADFPCSKPTQGSPLIVQPNFEVVVQPFVRPAVHWALAQMASLVRPDQAYVYKITRESIIRALRSDWTTEEILSFLQTGKRTETPEAAKQLPALPQNVVYSIRDWSSGYGRCTVMRIAIVQCDNAALADRLVNEGLLCDYLVGRISPTALVVRDDALKKVITLLEKANLPPPAEPIYITDTPSAERYGMALQNWQTK